MLTLVLVSTTTSARLLSTSTITSGSQPYFRTLTLVLLLLEYHRQELPQIKKLSQQTCVCHDKTQVCHDKTCLLLWQTYFVMTKRLLWQIFVKTNMCLSQKHTFVTCFVVTNMCLSWQTLVCCEITFVATKMILVAALANDTRLLLLVAVNLVVPIKIL